MKEETTDIPTDREMELLKDGIEWSKEHSPELLETALEDYGPEESDLRRGFGPGSFGMFEVGAISRVLIDNWECWVVESPALAMYPELHRMALIAQEYMMEIYQRTMSMELEGEENALRHNPTEQGQPGHIQDESSPL